MVPWLIDLDRRALWSLGASDLAQRCRGINVASILDRFETNSIFTASQGLDGVMNLFICGCGVLGEIGSGLFVQLVKFTYDGYDTFCRHEKSSKVDK